MEQHSGKNFNGFLSSSEEKHKNGNIYKELCQVSNEMSKAKNKGKQLKNGWTVIDNYRDKKSNFKGVLYGKDGQYAITFVGTDPKSIKDHAANLKMVVTGDSPQIKQAENFAKDMFYRYPEINKDNTVSLGHSEGGTEATTVGLGHGLKTYTFNPYGVWKSKLPEDADYSLITNYRDAHDPVSKTHANIGNTYIVPSTQNKFKEITPFGWFGSHRLQNMGDITKSIELEDYKKNNKLFIDHITDAEITREDIASMSPDLFGIYESEIDERLRNNQIYSENQLRGRARYIEGYTRADGTKVRGYYRRLN